MRLAIAAFGIAALAGAGYVIGKKIIEKKRQRDEFYGIDDIDAILDEDGVDVGVYAKQKNYGDKIKKASLFAVGAIKTGADKLNETVHDIKSQDMVKKGGQTVDAVKATGGNIRNDIKREVEDLKCMVSAINDEEQSNPPTDENNNQF